MAEETDKSQKTEDPTPKRKEEAREKGQVPQSKEVNHLIMLTASGLVLFVFFPDTLRQLGHAMYRYIEYPDLMSNDLTVSQAALGHTIREVLGILFLPFCLLVVAALMTGFIQHGFVFSFKKLEPKLEKVSIIKGFKRIYSGKALVEFLRNVLKMVIVLAISCFVIYPQVTKLVSLPNSNVSDLLGVVGDQVFVIFASVVSVFAVIAGLDFFYQRYVYFQNLRMSKQEVKDEQKQLEGDPHVKAKLKQIRMDRAKKRVMAAVPEADVVVTNPTHFAVAMKYDMETMNAPVVVSKGADLLAKTIRDLADEHGITKVSNPPLARALFDTVEIDQEIPPEHYKAVAEIISYVFQLKGKTIM